MIVSLSDSFYNNEVIETYIKDKIKQLGGYIMKKRSLRFFSFLTAVILVVSLCSISVSADWNPAVLSSQKLTVDGLSIECEKYNINGNNYFKLRDLALLLNGTGSQFSVGWDDATKTVSIYTGEEYAPNGSELVIGADQSSTAAPSKQTIMINGIKRDDFSVYNIGGNNYFKLRDLGSALNFSVGYDAATRTAVVDSDFIPYDMTLCYVDNVDDLMKNIKSNTTIYLAPGTYNLTDWIDEKAATGNWTAVAKQYPYFSTNAMDWDRELDICNIENFRLIGSGVDFTSIVVEPRYANVIGFVNCITLTIRGITMGHTPEKGYCTGNVLYFNSCDDVYLSDLDLYGCGIYGIAANGLTYAVINNTVIHDCSYGALDIRNSYALSFNNCQMKDNEDLTILEFYQTGAVYFYNCSFSGNKSDFVDGCSFIGCNRDVIESFPGDVITFDSCTFGNTEYESLLSSGLLDTDPAIVVVFDPRIV